MIATCPDLLKLIVNWGVKYDEEGRPARTDNWKSRRLVCREWAAITLIPHPAFGALNCASYDGDLPRLGFLCKIGRWKTDDSFITGRVYSQAIDRGHLEYVRRSYYTYKFVMPDFAATRAAVAGRFPCLRFILEEAHGKLPQQFVMNRLAEKGRADMLVYLWDKGVSVTQVTAWGAIITGHVGIFKWCIKHAGVPLNDKMMRVLAAREWADKLAQKRLIQKRKWDPWTDRRGKKKRVRVLKDRIDELRAAPA